MRATGVVRRIDNLGRIVIPKEIRRTLRIREGDPLEIFTNHEGEVILKKYSPIGELSTFAQAYTDSISQLLGKTAVVCDRDQIIAASGAERKSLQGQEIDKKMEDMIEERRSQVAQSGDKNFVNITDSIPFYAQAAATIICEGDAIGAVMILDNDKNSKLGENELKMVTVAADFLGRQMES
ncbi:MAG: stage V sporulation T C-terminal domain-containing protein [Lachnospiraceae bacterium]|nr:stage V sporulation T C-terminal domain-containing protein [Lachnospiraceae bacterium]